LIGVNAIVAQKIPDNSRVLCTSGSRSARFKSCTTIPQ
jgi:hypothetical protein